MHVILGVYVLMGIYVLGDMCPGGKCPGVIIMSLGYASGVYKTRVGLYGRGGGGGASVLSPLSPRNGPRQHPGLKKAISNNKRVDNQVSFARP